MATASNDLIIGADNANSGKGFAYVLYGAKDFTLPSTSALDNLGARGFRVGTSDTGAKLGARVDGGGDFNGDGYDDIIIGAYGTNSRKGAAHIIFGGPSHAGSVDVGALGDRGFSIFGAAADERLGFAVASLGDVNGDGFDDMALSVAKAANGSTAKAGAVYVLFGRADGFANIDLSSATLPSNLVVALRGTSANQELGLRIDAAGDVDGDGRADLLISDLNSNNFLVLGKELGATPPAPSVVTSDFTANTTGDDAVIGEFLQTTNDDTCPL